MGLCLSINDIIQTREKGLALKAITKILFLHEKGTRGQI